MANEPRRIATPVQVQHASAAYALEELVLLFLEMFSNVVRVNQENPWSGWGFNDTGALIEDEVMRRYTVLLSRLTPFDEHDFRGHCAWVRRSVFGSLQVALRRLQEMSGVPAPVFVPNPLIMYIVELFVTMANSVLDNANLLPGDEQEDEQMEEGEEDEEEEREEDEEEEGEEDEEELVQALEALYAEEDSELDR